VLYKCLAFYSVVKCPQSRNHTALLQGLSLVCIIHCVQKKHPLMFLIITRAFLCRSVFVPVERAMNTLQFTYLQSWWRHNGVTLHVTKVYFIELLLNININILSLKFSFKDKNLRKKTLKMWKFFLPKTDKKFCTKIQFKKMKIKRLFAKFANNWYRSNALPKWSTMVFSKYAVFTLGCVETQLGRFVNFAEL